MLRACVARWSRIRTEAIRYRKRATRRGAIVIVRARRGGAGTMIGQEKRLGCTQIAVVGNDAHSRACEGALEDYFRGFGGSPRPGFAPAPAPCPPPPPAPPPAPRPRKFD